jgi:transcriptional regulator with XRE-family HTH domain
MTTRTPDGLRLRPFLVPSIRPADLARTAGVSRQYVAAVLAGKRPPSKKLVAAARELGLPVDVLLHRPGVGERDGEKAAA